VDAADNYFNGLLEQGYPEEQALKWTQKHYPEFQGPSSPNAESILPEQPTIIPEQPLMGVPKTILLGSPTSQPDAQIVYLVSSDFKPNPNYRHFSYLIIGLATFVWLIGSVMSANAKSDIGIFIASSGCCGLFGIACLFDAAYYHTKKNWEMGKGERYSKSVMGIIANIIIAVISFFYAFIYLLIVSA